MAKKKSDLNITLVSIVAIIVIGVIAGIYFFQNQSNTNTVTATGTYQTKVQPDQVLIYLSIQTKNSSAQDAKDKNSVITSDVLTSLNNLGISSSEIETENYNIYPDYNFTGGRQEIIGYTATNNIKITTSNFTNVGKIIDASVNSGALVSYINFQLSTQKTNDYKATALAEAAKDAKTKAQSIASGLGKNIGDLVSVSSSDFNYYPVPLYAEGSSADVKQVVTNIQPKSLDITATVSVTYKIV